MYNNKWKCWKPVVLGAKCVGRTETEQLIKATREQRSQVAHTHTTHSSRVRCTELHSLSWEWQSRASCCTSTRSRVFSAQGDICSVIFNYWISNTRFCLHISEGVWSSVLKLQLSLLNCFWRKIIVTYWFAIIITEPPFVCPSSLVLKNKLVLITG